MNILNLFRGVKFPWLCIQYVHPAKSSIFYIVTDWHIKFQATKNIADKILVVPIKEN